MRKRRRRCTGTIELKFNECGFPTFGPVCYSDFCMSDGSLEADVILQKMVHDGELSLDDFREICLEVNE